MQKLVREDMCGERPSQTIIERYKKERQIAFEKLCVSVLTKIARLHTE